MDAGKSAFVYSHLGEHELGSPDSVPAVPKWPQEPRCLGKSAVGKSISVATDTLSIAASIPFIILAIIAMSLDKKELPLLAFFQDILFHK